MSTTSERKLMTWFGVALVLLIANSIVSAWNVWNIVNTGTWVVHTYQVLGDLDGVVATLRSAEADQRGYIITGQIEEADRFEQASGTLDQRVESLRRMVSDNPEQSASIERLERMIETCVGVMRTNLALRRERGFEAARQAIAAGRGEHSVDEVDRLVDEAKGRETTLLARRTALSESSIRWAIGTFSFATLLAVGLLGTAYHVVRRDLAERKRSELAAEERTRLSNLAADVGAALVQGESLPDILRFCCEALVRHLDGAFARIWTYNEAEDMLELRASAGIYTHIDGPHGRVPVGRFKIGMIARERQPHLTNAAIGDPRVSDQEWARREGMVAFAGYPLLVDGRLLGVMAMFARRALSDDAIRAMATVASGIALGIDRKHAEVAIREAEERLRLMFESIRDYAIVAIDLEGRVANWNSGAERVFGWTEAEIVGRPAAAFFTPEDLAAGLLDREMAKARETGRAEHERWHLRKDGGRFVASGLLVPVRDGAGLLRGFTMVARDITERKRHEDELHRAKEAAVAAQEAAEAASQAKSTFLANMSHELRTPLNAIIGYSEMLQEEAEEHGRGDSVSDLKKIQASGKHLLGLINDVLDLSKIEAGKMDLYIENFDVAEMVRGVVATITPLLAKNGNTLEVHCPEDFGTMHADLTKVRQVLLNLLSNASKFTDRGAIGMGVSRETLEGKEWLAFEVVDDGIGMTREQIARLFHPFTQADLSTTRKYGGTGLGLTIARRFCQLMGGDIVVASEPGRGSTFTVRLPVRVVGRGLVPSAIAPVTPSITTGPGGLVLVIDDDPMVHDLLRRTLAKEGFRVECASNGQEGLRLAREIRPDAITLDAIMPGMDGWVVLSALKSDPGLAEIPVIMITMIDDKNLGYTLGASDYLTKPVDRERLSAILKKYRDRCPDDCLALVVEDDVNSRELVCELLDKDGWTVLEAENGRVALERVRERLPDLILLDLMMPEMDGFAFTAELRRHEEWSEIPILVLTAKDLTEEDRRRLNGDVLGYLQKGAYTREELLYQIRREVSHHLRRVKETKTAAAAACS